MQRESRIEKIVVGMSEVIGISFLLGLTMAVCGYAKIRDVLEKTFDKEGYLRRQEEKEQIVNDYISALKQICGETQKGREQREERQFYEYLERQGVSFN